MRGEKVSMSSSLQVRSLISSRIHDHLALVEELHNNLGYQDTVETVAGVITGVLRAGQRVFFFGNGGSAADAQHLAAELAGRFLLDRRSLATWALNNNMSAITAIGNDYSFDEVYSRQIEGLGRPGDLAFGISTSGTSPNILRALEVAADKQMVTVGLTGATGGKLRDLVDHCICIPSTQTPRIQEAHILTGHILCELIENELFGNHSATE
jgi:D-sedoheptulose 7-phosphate isomerase